MRIRALLVDDEPLARQRLRHLAGSEPDLEVVGECADGLEAVEAIGRDVPDVVFLDVQMPEVDGFGVLERLPRNRLPLVVFTTAYDQHAVRAFESHALDYLLKPIQPARFKAAVQRVRERLLERQAGETARGLLDLLAARQATAPASDASPVVATAISPDSPTPGGPHLTRLTIRTPDKVVVVKTAEIQSIESAGNYVAVHVGKESHILRETLSALEAQLDPEKFLRISRAAIVNLDHVRELQPMFKGEHTVVLSNGQKLPMTRGLREVEQALKYG